MISEIISKEFPVNSPCLITTYINRDEHIHIRQYF
nr:MAG TPA: hypothetical protein [Crassvirales sp.]